MRLLVYFWPVLIIVLFYAVMYLVAYQRAKAASQQMPKLFGAKFLNALMVCLIVVVVNFIIIYVYLGHRDKPVDYILPHLKNGVLER